MEKANVCNRCGHENPKGFKYCNNCGRSRNTQQVAKKFPTLVEIHEDANLDRVAMQLFEDAKYIPTVHELREAVNSLNANWKQVFIKVMSLDLPGIQARRTYAQVAQERNGSSSAVRSAFWNANYALVSTLGAARRRELRRQEAEDDEATAGQTIVFEHR